MTLIAFQILRILYYTHEKQTFFLKGVWGNIFFKNVSFIRQVNSALFTLNTSTAIRTKGSYKNCGKMKSFMNVFFCLC